MSALVMIRTRALVALIVAVLSLSALPSIVLDGDAVPTASAAAAGYDVRVGWMSEIINWNPMYIAMVEDWVATFLMYSALWQYDENWGNPEPDLVLSYNTTYHPDDTMTMWLNLTHNAYFRNVDTGTDDTSMPLKARDVTYTFWVACSKQSTAWEYYMKDYVPSVVNDYTVRLDIPFIKATAIDDLTGIPIVPDGFYNWSGVALQDPMDPEQCLGSGPFTFDGYVEASWYRFRTAPNYHGSADFPEERTLTIDTITYNIASEASGLAADMNSGILDVAVMSGEPDIYLKTLVPDATNKMVKEAVQELGICDIAINAVPLEFRVDSKSAAADYCDGNPHLLDPAVRKALLMTLNKPYIRWAIMKNLSTTADSVIPIGGFWYHDVNDLAFDPAGARQVLLDAHYVDDGGDFLIAGPDSYFMQNGFDTLFPDVSPRLEKIRCQAPNTDPSYSLIATSWLSWAALAGIGFDPDLTGETQESYMINSAWYKCLYDIWVWHWGWGPEPLSDLSVWQTYEIDNGGDNCQMPMGEWYVHGNMDVDDDGDIDYVENYTTSPYVSASMIEEFGMDEDGFRGFSSYDQNFSEAMHTPDLYERRDIVYRLQDMVYDSYCETPPYYDLGLYAYSEARYQGWGDWSLHSGRTVVSGMPWVWFDLIPAGNMIPKIDVGLGSSYDLDIGELGTFSITVSDVEGDKLWVNWTFGDGSDPVNLQPTPTTGQFDVSTSHSYSTAGTYTLTVTVTDGYAGHTVTDTASVVVSPPATAKPVIGALTYDPIKAYIGEEVTWTFTVTDTDSTNIRTTVAWGDGKYFVSDLTATPGTAIPVEALHTYTAASVYTVTIYASDGTNNVSIARSYTVISNSPPTAPVVSSVSALEGESRPISATTTDVDPDTLIVTWEWDDGTFTVTGPYDTSSNPGAVVTSAVTHTWDIAGSYDFTVWVDDQEGNNVSTTATATISPEGTPVEPSVTSMVQSPNPGIVEQAVTLTIGAYDSNGDALDFYVEFGDGEAATDSTAAATGEQTVVMTHTYATVDNYTLTVYINDGTFNVSADYTVRIAAASVNSAPEIVLMSAYSAMYNETFVVTPTEVFDADGDDVSVWYEWGDDTESAGDDENDYEGTHVYSVTGNVTLTAYADDNNGHNVSTTTTVTVSFNRRPETKSLTVSPASGPYYVGSTLTFNVTVSDREGDEVTIKMDFGDGSAVLMTTATPSGAGANVTVTFTHTYDAAETYYVVAWAQDGYDHPNPVWLSLPRTVTISEEPRGDADTSWVLIAGIGLLILVVVVVVAMLLKKRKGGKVDGGAGESSGDMEGMAPPPE